MKINFLQDAEGSRLTKTYTPTEVRPYPNAATFNSFHYDIESLEHFHNVLVAHAEEGHCLLKGELSKNLKEERRAGSTSPLTPTQYLLLDLDFDGGFDSVDQFLDAIGISDTSYILHHSASSGIRSKTGLRVHLVVLLDKPMSPSLIKSWLQYLNLTVPQLRDLCQLSANGFSLKWALDVTTCQNDKLIFIADPVCIDVDDPMAGKRFELHQRGQESWTFPFKGGEFAALTDQTNELINQRREENGLPRRKATFGSAEYDGSTIEYLKNPTRAQVTEWKKERGFVYLNLNGGDSWGYYYPDGKPEYLRNFKGEPVVRLRDIDPEYYASVVQEEAEEEPLPETTVGADGIERWVIHEYKTSVYYKVEYDGQTVTLHKSDKDGVKTHYANNHDGEEIELIPEWTVEFDPTRTVALDPPNRWINRYQPTAYRLAEYKTPVTICPPVIETILRSLTVEEDMYQHFLDCLAHVWQTGTPTRTAHLFRGTTGTGKGTLFNEILSPLFGKNHCQEIGMDVFDTNFNGYVRDALWVMVDEGEIDDRSSARLISKCNNLITEETIQLHVKRENAIPIPNYVNLIIATNNRAPLKLPKEDRRWNVSAAQETSLKDRGFDTCRIEDIKHELSDFAAFLTHRKYDANKVRYPLNNEARNELFLSTETSVEQIFRAFKEGDLDFFCEHFDDEPEDAIDTTTITYRQAVKRWLRAYENDTVKLSNNECKAAYQFLTGQRISPIKFGSIAKRRWTMAKPVRDGDNVFKGWVVSFKLKEERWRYRILNEKPKLQAIK